MADRVDVPLLQILFLGQKCLLLEPMLVLFLDLLLLGDQFCALLLGNVRVGELLRDVIQFGRVVVLLQL